MALINPAQKNLAHKVGLYVLYGTCFTIPFSTSLSAIGTVLTFICWIISGKITELPALVKSNPVVMSAMILLGLLTVGLLYTSAPIGDALSFFKKYRVLLFIPMVISMLEGNQKNIDRTIAALFLGCMILLAGSYCIYFSIGLTQKRVDPTLIEHINHASFMTILCYMCLLKIFTSNKHRLIWGIILAASLFNLFYMSSARTGWVLLAALFTLFIFQVFSWKKQLLLLLAAVSTAALVYQSSDKVQEEVQLSYNQFKQFEQNISFSGNRERLFWWKDSVKIFSLSPIYGHGTGSFKTLHLAHKAENNTRYTNNPHNEYVLLAVQLGVIGLAAFLALLCTQLKNAMALPLFYKRLYQGLIAFMAVGCLFNSHLLDSTNSHFFTFLSGALSSIPLIRNNKDIG